MVAVGLAVGCMALSGVASAASVQAPTVVKKFKLSQDSSGRTFSGKIDSSKGKCKKSRKVKVIFKRNVLASEKTDGQGKFKTQLPGVLDPGTYFLKVRKSSYRRKGNKVSCGKAKSPTIKVN